jgi:alpha-tubulin suppressor-like RCC1 family protein
MKTPTQAILRIRNSLFQTLLHVLVAAVTIAAIATRLPASAASVPNWVGAPTHNWNPRLGGGMWFQHPSVVNGIRPALDEYPRPVLVGIRSDAQENGYRFDLNTFDANAPVPCVSHGLDKLPQEGVLQALEVSGNVEFMLSMPTVDTYASVDGSSYSPLPYTVNGEGKCVATGIGYPWQRPNYYAAYLQYLIGPVTMAPAQYNGLNPTYNFFSDANCTMANTASETAVGSNWANLRARRGHPAPYKLSAVILGIEPYDDAQEKMVTSGARYGTIAKAFRNAIRARGGPLATIPLGLHIDARGTVSDPGRPWLWPMLDAVDPHIEDFSYLDLYHLYALGDKPDHYKRTFPVAIRTGSTHPNAISPGWEEWWAGQGTWGGTDFTRRLWWYQDVRRALNAYEQGLANHFTIGCSEHGITIISSFTGNDMSAGLHWALWLSEMMRYNSHWDMNWVLAEQGWSHAQLHFRDNQLTRTPGHYVYKMAQQFYGYEYRANTYEIPSFTTGVFDEGNYPPPPENNCCVQISYKSPDVDVRVFRNPVNNRYHLFVVNNHASMPASITGWEGWHVVKWDRINAPSFASQNPIGEPGWTPETIRTMSVPHTDGQALAIAPISVNHIELSETPVASPLVSAGWFHTLAAKLDGTLWTWGDNYAGQLGTGSTEDEELPQEVEEAGRDVKAVAAGGWHSLVLKESRTVMAMGYNYYGQLGTNPGVNLSVPSYVQGPGGVGLLRDVVAIAAGDYSSYALKNDGTVWAWGNNFNGQLGTGDYVQNSYPVRVRDLWETYPEDHLRNVVAIAAGGSHCLALKSDGTLRSWGWNAYGQLGNGTTTQSTFGRKVYSSINPVPVEVTGVIAIAAGDRHSMALKADGSLLIWGHDGSGQLGNGSGDTADKLMPVTVSGLTDVRTISAGGQYSFVTKNTGAVLAWGANNNGQLGLGHFNVAHVPTSVSSLPSTRHTVGGRGPHAVSIGQDYKLRAWGANADGQLGRGAASGAQHTPAQVGLPGAEFGLD